MSATSAKSALISGLTLAVMATVIGFTRPKLNARLKQSAVQHDIYPLPPPDRLVRLSLGYRSALADYLFAQTLVSYGLHFQERRPFESVGNYLDAITALDPRFVRPYRIADTLLTLQPKAVGPEYYRKARAILERGMKEFPFDAALWSSAGQFMAYLAPARLSDPAEEAEWRLAGARALAHACELVPDDATIPYHCITAAGLLTRAGKADAARQFLKRVTMITDDPQINALASGALQQLGGDPEAMDRRHRFEDAWRADLPFVSLGAMLIVGPNWKPDACAGLSARCPTSWREWGQLESLKTSISEP